MILGGSCHPLVGKECTMRVPTDGSLNYVVKNTVCRLGWSLQ